jgi:hypothetical protein
MGLKKIISFRKSRSSRIENRLVGLFHFLLKPSFFLAPLVLFLTPSVAQIEVAEYKVHLGRVKNGIQKISFYPKTHLWDGLLEFSYYSKELYWPLRPGAFIKNQQALSGQGDKIKIPGTGIQKMEFEYFNPNKKLKGVFPSFRPTLKRGRTYFFNPIIAFGQAPETGSLPFQLVFKNPKKLWNTLTDGYANEEKISLKFNNSWELQKELIFFSKDPPDTLIVKNAKLLLWGLDIHNYIGFLYESGVLEALYQSYENGPTDTPQKKIHVVFRRGGNEKSELSKMKSNLIFANGILINISGRESKEEILKKISIAFSKYWICSEVLGDIYWNNPEEPHDPSHVWLMESVSRYLQIQHLMKGQIYSDTWLKNEFLDILVSQQKRGNEDLFSLAIDLYQSGESEKLFEKNLSRMLSYYDRGVLGALYLDLVMRKKGINKEGLLGWLKEFREFKNEGNDQEKVKDPWASYLKIQQAGIKTIMYSYIYGAKPIPHDFYLNQIGWEFIQKGEEHRSFLKGGKLFYFPEIGHYVCIKKGKNSLGMEKGDVIISINNNEVFNRYDLKELIFVNKNFRRELGVKVLVIRNNKQLVLRGKATKKVRTRHFELMPDSNPFTNEYKLRKEIFH